MYGDARFPLCDAFVFHVTETETSVGYIPPPVPGAAYGVLNIPSASHINKLYDATLAAFTKTRALVRPPPYLGAAI